MCFNFLFHLSHTNLSALDSLRVNLPDPALASKHSGKMSEGYSGVDWNSGATAPARGSTAVAPKQPLIMRTNGTDLAIPLMPEGWKPHQQGIPLPPQQPFMQAPFFAPAMRLSSGFAPTTPISYLYLCVFDGLD